MKQRKSKRFVAGIVLAVVGCLGFIGSFGMEGGKAAGFIGSAILAAIGVLLIYLDSKSNSVDKSTPTQTQASIPTPARASIQPTAAPVPESEKNFNLFDDVYNNCVLMYEYEENIFLQEGVISSVSGNGGKSLKFVQEPQNAYDNKAVAVYLNGIKIGYVYKGRTQDMLNDWIRRGDTYKGYINKVSVSENKATYKIGFYKSLSAYEHKTFSLTKTSKKIDEYTKREDNLLGCEVGDAVTIECDYGEGCYTVFNGSYEEIGELSAGAKSFIENGTYKKLVGVIEQIEYDDNDKQKIKITVYLVS